MLFTIAGTLIEKVYKNTFTTITMKKSALLYILIAIIFVSLFLLINNLIKVTSPVDKNNNQDTNPANQTNENSAINPNASANTNNQNPSSSSGSSSVSSSGGSGGSGGGSSSSGASGSSDSGCPLIPISYALKNFMKNSICLAYSNNICTSKKVDCSVDIYNLDETISGQFTLKIILEYSQNNTPVQEFSFSDTINSQSSKTFEKSIIFESQSPEGEANKDYTCSFLTVSVPKKEVC